MTTTREILEFEVAEFLQAADIRAKLIGSLEKSIRGLEASQVGALGELVGMRYLDLLGIEYEDISATTHDAIVKIRGEEKRLEFKTKERTVAPLDYFDCTAPAYNSDYQKPDYYLFISLLSSGKSEDIKRFRKAYILGSISGEGFREKAVSWNPGQLDTSNNWTPSIACLNIPISELNPPKVISG